MAHQVLTIREEIGKEILFGLKSIKNDNAEALRYANQAAVEGLVEAEKKRRLTRMSNEGESTPLRERNFLDLTVLIINLAFDLVKRELTQEGSAASLNTVKFLNEFIANCSVSDKEDAYERLEEERKGNETQNNTYTFSNVSPSPSPPAPRTLLEQMYYRGITEGVTPRKVNILKLAQSLMEKCCAVANDLSKIISEMAVYSRPYYKMIKVRDSFSSVKVIKLFISNLLSMIG